MSDTIDAKRITDLQVAKLEAWYRDEPSERLEPDGTIDGLVAAQHFANFSLWNLEDQARRRDVSDATIAEVKRAIDGWNQRRNDLMEKVDEHVLAAVAGEASADAVQHSETAGMIVDRLSILALKCHHMALNVERASDADLAEECRGKLHTLREQRGDLGGCLARLMQDVADGRRFFKVYRQHKAYNDPRLNPALAGDD